MSHFEILTTHRELSTNKYRWGLLKENNELPVNIPIWSTGLILLLLLPPNHCDFKIKLTDIHRIAAFLCHCILMKEMLLKWHKSKNLMRWCSNKCDCKAHRGDWFLTKYYGLHPVWLFAALNTECHLVARQLLAERGMMCFTFQVAAAVKLLNSCLGASSEVDRATWFQK